MKNSWGLNWGDSGYFWMSYAQVLHNCAAFIAAKDTSSRIYGHDALSARNVKYYSWGASVFIAIDQGSILLH